LYNKIKTVIEKPEMKFLKKYGDMMINKISPNPSLPKRGREN